MPEETPIHPQRPPQPQPVDPQPPPIDPPFPLIARSLRAGKVVPFLGAGVNLGDRNPIERPWEARSSAFLPSGSELSNFLAGECAFPSPEDYERANLAKVASFFAETGGRASLRECLHEVFDREYEPYPVHHYLAELAARRPLLVVTTNYDDLLEKAFEKAGARFDLVIHPTDRKDIEASILWRPSGAVAARAEAPNSLCIDLKTTSVIYKIHGSVSRSASEEKDEESESFVPSDQYVITEEDYVDFLYRMTAQGAVPAQFIRYFRERHFLFLGYGLGDWNLRVILRNLRSAKPGAIANAGEERPKSWAIQFRPSALERELWQAREVKIYNQDINLFVQRLREADAGP